MQLAEIISVSAVFLGAVAMAWGITRLKQVLLRLSLRLDARN